MPHIYETKRNKKWVWGWIDEKWVPYTRAQRKTTATIAQTFVPPFASPAFVGAGKFVLVPRGFAGCRELGLLVAFVGRGELEPLLEIVGLDKFGLLMGVVSPGGFVVSLGTVGF